MMAMSSPTSSPQSTQSSQLRAAFSNRAVFFAALALIYVLAIIAATLTLNPYFSQTWDVTTFIQAGHSLIDDGNPFDLYAQSRAAQTWPYAYPPLHAIATALALLAGKALPGLPDFVWARVPAIIADVGVALALFSIVRRKSNDETIARAAAMLWLFNPITFYDTAVQGHFESEWLLFVLLAYIWSADARHVALPAIALAVAVLFKQVAVLFALPLWITWLIGIFRDRRKDSAFDLILSLAIFVFVGVVVCLPFLLYSDDFLYMNLTYVENVPVQTQSWIVALLGLTRDAPNAMTSDFVLLRYQTIVTMLAALGIGWIAARRGTNLYLTATLIVLAFFLTSKKVMGYYYVMLFPFLFADLLPRKRFDLALITVVATTFISLSPYYAAWTNHTHWWVYALLGIANSAFLVWLGKNLMEHEGRRTEKKSSVSGLSSVVVISGGLFFAAVFAALLQPFSPDNGSPIRAPIIAVGMEANAIVLLGVLVTLTVFALIAIHRAVRTQGERLRLGSWNVPLIFAPLFFSVYTLTKESTAIFEIVLKALGV